MPILSLLPHSAGTAINLSYAMPTTGRAYIILRKKADTFTGETDPEATVIRAGLSTPSGFLDTFFLTNGTPYFYKSYWTADGSTWTGEATKTCTPNANYRSTNADPLTFLRERIDKHLQTSILRGELTHPHGAIPVWTAPPVSDETTFPVVTVQLTSETAEVRGLGDELGVDWPPDESSWCEESGWLSRVQIAVIGWSLNSDERGALRRALREGVIANLDVFDKVGFLTVDWSPQDVEDFQAYGVPMYQTVGQFSCLAPVTITSDYGLVRDVGLTLTPVPPAFDFTAP